MKNIFSSFTKTLTAFCLLILVSGCLKDNITKTYTILTPVYKDKAEVLANIKSSNPQPLNSTGKIYMYGSYLFLNELNKGVHIINNADPAKPARVAFIEIPGNIDIAVKGNTLYADLYTDLVAINISNPLQAEFKKILPKVFPERMYHGGFTPDSTKVIVDWIRKDTTVSVSGNDDFGFGCPNCFILMDRRNVSLANGGAAAAPGIAGSMARFAVVNDYMYAVNISSLNVIDISSANNPALLGSSYVGWNIETIFPFKDKLFIGSSAGMFIYNISNPSAPVAQGQFNHARACDPVVADDDYAFVTLRSGNFCTGVNNQLDVIDVRNVLSPTLVKTYPMTNPHGLAKDGDVLFLCDGKDGLKVFDVSNVNDLKLIKHIKGIETFDAIAWNNILMVVASDGLYQYNYSNPANPVLLSKLSISK